MWKSRLLCLLYWFYRPIKVLGFERSTSLMRVKARTKSFVFGLLAPTNYMLTQAGSLTLYVQPSACFTYSVRFEPYTTRLFESAIKPASTVLDIGANIGYFSILAGRAAGPQGKVYAFEPVLENFKLR